MFVQRAPHFPPTTGLPIKNVPTTNVDSTKTNTQSTEPSGKGASTDTNVSELKTDSKTSGNEQKGSNNFGEVDVYVSVSEKYS